MKVRIYKIKLVVTVILLIGFIVNGVFITIYNVDKSSNVGEISGDIFDLKMKNNKLTEEISSMDSLTKFVERSKIVGYVAGGYVLYFNQKETVAQAR